MNRALSEFDKAIEQHFDNCCIDDWANQRRQGYFDSISFCERITKWFNFSKLNERVDDKSPKWRN